ncbi:carbohydrate-binding domain-containing protein [Demequina sp.]|uniref:carbohydrate-binding domain-containing protein n=1 Tax=Demequina sp. TaxID=2050685 RepID=UPI003D0CEB94
MRRKPSLIFAGLTLGALALAGCTSTTGTTASGETATDAQVTSDMSSDYAELAYSDLGIDEADAVDASAATDIALSGSEDVTISEAGTYRLSGTLKDASVVVDVAEGQVNLILDGVSITADETAAINVVNADSVVISLADGTTNALSDSATAAVSEEEDAPNAVLFSTADLYIEGSGSLTVSATINDGITSKDSLIISGGSITVDSVDDGVRGKDHIVVLDGVLTINAGGDGIKADNDEVLTDASSTKGVAWFTGGTVAITAGDDGVSAERQVTVDGGSVSVSAVDDGIHTEGVLSISDGSVNVTQSNEGLEGAVVLLSGGTGSVVASDDGINVAGGYLEETTTTSAEGGTDAQTDSQTDTRAQGGGPGGGEPPSGDMGGERPAGGGARPSDGADRQMQGGGMGGDASVTDPSSLTVSSGSGGGMGAMPGESNDGSGRYLLISGGTWNVDAQGDGLDANGTMSITGGTTTVQGPSTNGNGPTDADSYSVTGGTLLAVGSSGMLVTPGEGSQGNVVAVFSGGVAAGSEVTLTDASGTVVASVTTERVSQALIFSSPDIESGASYTVSVAGVEVGEVTAA